KPSFSPPTTSTRPRPWPTEWPSSRTAGSWSRAPQPSWAPGPARPLTGWPTTMVAASWSSTAPNIPLRSCTIWLTPICHWSLAWMSVMSTKYVALAYNMTFLREEGVLKRIRGTPMSGISYLGAIAGNAVTNAALQMVIIVVAGRLFFGTGWPRDWGELILFVAAGVVCFASLGVAFSHVIPNFESTSAYVNAVFLPVILISGVFYDIKHVPGFIKG